MYDSATVTKLVLRYRDELERCLATRKPVASIRAGGRTCHVHALHARHAQQDVILMILQPGRVQRSAEELQRRYGLSPRQIEVARLLAGGRSNKEIAERLTISPHTAASHTRAVMLKLGVKRRCDVRPALEDHSPIHAENSNIHVPTDGLA